jgi:hypothetical protein
MHTLSKASTALLLAGLFALVSVGSASAGSPVTVEVKKERGEWQPGGETINVRDQAKNVYIRVRSNLGDQSTTFRHEACCSPAQDDFKTRYFDNRTGDNITGAVKGSGYSVDLNGSAARAFRIRIKPLEPTTEVFCVFPYFEVGSSDHHGYISVNSPFGCL